MLLDERNLDDKITVQNYLLSPIGYLWGGKFREIFFRYFHIDAYVLIISCNMKDISLVMW